MSESDWIPPHFPVQYFSVGANGACLVTLPVFPEAEPFGEPSSLEASGLKGEMFRFGYRVPGTETVLTAIEVPFSVIQQSIPQEVSVRLNQYGAIIASLDFDGMDECKGIKEVSLVQLVEEFIEPRHLSMEEIKSSDLEALLRSLECSIQLVRTTISTLEKRRTRHAQD